MGNFEVIQGRIKEKRKLYEAAEQAYYNSLQAWSLAQQGITGATPTPTPAQVEAKRTGRDTALAALQAEIELLTKEGTPQDLLSKCSANLPFLLFPLRLEARYVNLVQVTRGFKIGDVMDFSTLEGGDAIKELGFKINEEGVMTYQVPALFPTGDFPAEYNLNTWKPASGNYIKRKKDRAELRIRVYPDDFFLRAHEPALQPNERDAGIQWWKNICQGLDPQEEWVQFSTSVTPARAAWIIHAARPLNFSEGAPLPTAPVFDTQIALKDGAYTYPPTTRLLPERLVLRLYKGDKVKEVIGKTIPEPLILGLDPTQDPFEQNNSSGMAENGPSLKTPAYLNWIHDFEVAENQGMAFCIDLSEAPEFKEGVDKIVVLGVKMTADEVESSRLLQEQLQDHLYKEEGLSVVPKGTATNNFEMQRSGIQQEKEALQYFKAGWGKPVADPSGLLTDEYRLMKALGLKNELRLPSGNITDISEAALMNELLWPATWGYYLLQSFSPDLEMSTREKIRQYFIKHVSGRGMLPVLRVGRQPYGILPISSFEHWKYPTQAASDEEKFITVLWKDYLSKLRPEWQRLAQKIRTVDNVGGQGLDIHFFEMLRTKPVSTEHDIQAEIGINFQKAIKHFIPDGSGIVDPSFQPSLIYNDIRRLQFDPALFKSLVEAYYAAAQPGYPKNSNEPYFPDLDGAFLSESLPLQKLYKKAWNYLEWLKESTVTRIWNHDISAVPIGDGSEDPAIDRFTRYSIFSTLTRLAVLRTYLETGMSKVTSSGGSVNTGLWLLNVKDFEMLHLRSGIVEINPASLSDLNVLEQSFIAIAGKFNMTQPVSLQTERLKTISPWETTLFSERNTVEPMKGIMKALDYFSKTPTARISRLLREHLDLCSHRLDAWLLGLVNQRLEKQRQQKPEGIRTGAFGYLLNLKATPVFNDIIVEGAPDYMPATPENLANAIIPVVHSKSALEKGIDLSGNGWQRTFLYNGGTGTQALDLNTVTGKVEAIQPVTRDDGFIHAPSTAHATAAAILRAAYLNHQGDSKSALLSVQLNSPRIRSALQLLEGMQQGTYIGELLGHYFERLLHDNSLNGSIYNLRIAFPVKRPEADTQSPSLMITMDGLALLKAVKADPQNWPTEIPGLLPKDYPKLRDAAVNLQEYLDALGDLLLAESVYQTANGNTERAAAALRILSEGSGQLDVPGIVQTPMKGSTISHRIGVVLSSPTSTTNWQGWPKSNTPRALLAFEINYWLSLRLPIPGNVMITVILSGGEQQKISLAELKIEPIDLLYAIPGSFADAEQSPLALYVQAGVYEKFGISHLSSGEKIRIDFKDRSLHSPVELSIFEISSLLASLRKIISESRPLSANDFLLPDKNAAAAERTDATRIHKLMKKQVLENTVIPRLVGTLRDQGGRLKAAIEQQQVDKVLQPLAKTLLLSLQTAWQQGVETSGTAGIFSLQQDSAMLLCQMAIQTAALLEAKLEKAKQQMAAIPATATGEYLLKSLQEIASSLFRNAIPLLPDFTLENLAEVSTCYKNRQLIENAEPEVIDSWIREASMVRKPLRGYRRSALLSEMLAPDRLSPLFTALQFPFFKTNKQPWAGGKIDEAVREEERPVISLLLELPATYDAAKTYAGFIIDEWPEWTPARTIDTGVAFQYNQPNTDPPQTILLAVSPIEEGTWQWPHLLGAVNESLEMSKIRLVTPTHIRNDSMALSKLLPAVLLPFMADNNGAVVTR